MSHAPDFAANRTRLLDRMAPDEAVILFATPHHIRNGDAEYRYRPSSDVYWLTGWTHPEMALFLRPGDTPLTLFVQAKDEEREIWTGYRPGAEGAKADFGADAAFEFAELATELPRLLHGVTTLHHAFAENSEHDAMLLGAIRKAARTARKNGMSVPETFHAPSRLLHEVRLTKSEAELSLLRTAAKITADAHIQAMRAARPGVSEHELDALIDYTFRTGGGNGPGYTNIVAGGVGATCLHYIDNDKVLQEGDLLLIDAGCEYGYYTADVTRTFPVSGTFTNTQREVYEWVLKAQLAAIDAARPGRPYTDMHDAAVRVLTEAMVALGLLKGDVDTLISEETYKKYYMHGTGHWLGLDVHDVGVYARGGESRPLVPGMVVTVEPGLYIQANDADAPAHLRGIGIRIEDDILVTDGEPENLTAAAPKTVSEVEALCSQALTTA